MLPSYLCFKTNVSSFQFSDTNRYHAHGVGGAEGAQGAHDRHHGGRARQGHAVNVQQLVQLAHGPHLGGGERRQLGTRPGVLRPDRDICVNCDIMFSLWRENAGARMTAVTFDV
ncbi:unnamed protein product [Colias eurytheme]|nr:unnamed protein product [Colias eurytheme]